MVLTDRCCLFVLPEIQPMVGVFHHAQAQLSVWTSAKAFCQPKESLITSTCTCTARCDPWIAPTTASNAAVPTAFSFVNAARSSHLPQQRVSAEVRHHPCRTIIVKFRTLISLTFGILALFSIGASINCINCSKQIKSGLAFCQR